MAQVAQGSSITEEAVGSKRVKKGGVSIGDTNQTGGWIELQ